VALLGEAVAEVEGDQPQSMNKPMTILVVLVVEGLAAHQVMEQMVVPIMEPMQEPMAHY
jgi:hypothetical protein